MAEISKDDLRKEINDILKDADLRVMSAKKVRQQVEEKLGCNLNSRKKEIDDLVMTFVNSKEDEEQEEPEEEEEEEDDEEKKKPAKRPAPKKAAPRSKRSKANSGSGSESQESDDDYEGKKPIPKKKAPPKRKGTKGSDSDSDDAPKPKAKPAGGRGKGGGYTRAYKLSPALAALMGQESMARHEVVKRVWALIKERNLYDQSNRQFAICDDDLYKVMGVKRFRTFGMMKYLKTHFHD